MLKRKIKIDDLRKFISVSDPQVSPDGRKVAFTVWKIRYDEDRYESHIWTFDRKSGTTEQLTFGEGVDTYPRWSPNGKYLLFLSSLRKPEHKNNKLWVIPMTGGESRIIADMEMAVTNPMWSPDTKKILFISRAWTEKKPQSDVKRIRRIKYKFDGLGFFEGRRPHLFVTNSKGGKPRQLTDGDFDVEVAKWFPNGQQIGIITNMEERADFTSIKDIYLMSSKGGELKKLTKGEHAITDLFWSPDGDEIAYVGHDNRRGDATNLDIWVMPSVGGSPSNLTSDFDRNIGQRILSDLNAPSGGTPVIWSPNCETIYFITTDIPFTNIYSVNKSEKKVKTVTEGKIVHDFSFSTDGSVMAYNSMDAQSPPELFINDMHGERQVTHFNRNHIDRLQISIPEHYTFKNELGNDIDAWMIKPPDFNPEEKYPMILEIHGGPTGAYSYPITFFLQVFAVEGYVSIYTNPRGSMGYGEDYVAAIMGHYGECDYRDIMSFVDQTLDQFKFIDIDRLGVTGSSYGGFMTNWIITHTNRFAAACTRCCVSNWVSKIGCSDIGYRQGKWVAEPSDPEPWKDLDAHWEKSPIKYVKNVKTPTLILQNEEDHRTPMEEGEQLFTALQRLGVDCELIRFPRESHALIYRGMPKHREEILKYIVGWFNKYLK